MQLSIFKEKREKRSGRNHLIDYSPIKSLDELEIRPHSGRGYPKGNVVYFLFRRGKLTYIGSTRYLADRLRKHRFRGRKFDSLAYLKISPRYEKLLIKIFKPPENIYLA